MSKNLFEVWLDEWALFEQIHYALQRIWFSLNTNDAKV